MTTGSKADSTPQAMARDGKVAEKAGRPWTYFESPVRKDQRARAIAARDGITEGLVSVFATIAPCRRFRLAHGHGRPTIRPAWRKCLFLYFCVLDRDSGCCPGSWRASSRRCAPVCRVRARRSTRWRESSA